MAINKLNRKPSALIGLVKDRPNAKTTRPGTTFLATDERALYEVSELGTWIQIQLPGNVTAITVGTTAAMSGTPGVIASADDAVTTSSVIVFSRNVTGGTPGEVSITSQTAGNFTLTSTGNETSTFNYAVYN